MKNYTYFDIAATTPIDKGVVDTMNELNSDYFGNPSSVHQIGQKSHNLIEKSRREIAEILNCKTSEIFFTSGGTESNNIVINGLLNKDDHFITSSYEHPSILNTAKEMENKIEQTNFAKPSISLVSNVTAEPINQPNMIKNLLIKQIYSKVRWRESVLFMIKNGVNEFIEIGPGKVLSGLVKRISDKVSSKSVNSIDEIKNLK